MFLLELGVPRNFDGLLNAVENVYLYDIDDLGAVVSASRGERAREAEKPRPSWPPSSTHFCAGWMSWTWFLRSRISRQY
jgi:glutamyl-tRNA reductase